VADLHRDGITADRHRNSIEGWETREEGEAGEVLRSLEAYLGVLEVCISVPAYDRIGICSLIWNELCQRLNDALQHSNYINALHASLSRAHTHTHTPAQEFLVDAEPTITHDLPAMEDGLDRELRALCAYFGEEHDPKDPTRCVDLSGGRG